MFTSKRKNRLQKRSLAEKLCFPTTSEASIASCHNLFSVLRPGIELHIRDIPLEFAKVHSFFESVKQDIVSAYQWITTVKTWKMRLQFINLSRSPTCHFWKDKPCYENCNCPCCSETVAMGQLATHSLAPCQGNTHKNPVFTPHWVAGPLIMSGVQKLNIITTALDTARAHPAV